MRKDANLRGALENFSPPDLHEQCRAHAADLVKSHSQAAEMLLLHKETAATELVRKDREIEGLLAQLADARAGNALLEAQVDREATARLARDVEVSELRRQQEREISALRVQHDNAMSSLRSAHAQEEARFAAERQTHAADQTRWLSDTSSLQNQLQGVKNQLQSVTNQLRTALGASRSQHAQIAVSPLTLNPQIRCSSGIAVAPPASAGMSEGTLSLSSI